MHLTVRTGVSKQLHFLKSFYLIHAGAQLKQRDCVGGQKGTFALLPSNKMLLYTERLRLPGLRIVRNTARWEEEKCHQSTASNLGVMVRARPWCSPTSALPALHPLQLCRLVDLHNTIDLTIGVSMILTRILLLAIHEHGCDAEVPRLGGGQHDLATTVFPAV